ncbi:hypothetical protein N0V95_002036 [Ascochyta clinopodiicola]|nr:hypothetical protein N0V95_002036 [Ascochyta clinopodiicola]
MTVKVEPTRYALDPIETPGIVHVENLTKESANAASHVLNLNTASHHIYTTDARKMGAHLHNHITHHTLALYSLGASSEQIIEHTKRNQTYQLQPPQLPDEKVVEEMGTPEGYRRYLGDEDYFLSFTAFFEREIAKLGYEKVLQKYMFGGTEVADDLLARMYHGYVHSLMYVGMGVEFKQLPLIAEGLAQAAVHDDMYYNEFLSETERLAAEANETALPLSELLFECRNYQSILTCSGTEYHFQLENGKWFVEVEMVRDGVCAKAWDDMARVCSRYRVNPNDLERATAELINATGESQSLTSLTNEQKARVLEYTGRVTLMMYAAMGCPPLDMEWILSHQPRYQNTGWKQVFERVCEHKDDGHMSKLIRALKHAEEVSKPYDHLPEFYVKQHMFLPAAIAAVDSSSDVPMIGIQHFDIIRGAGYAKMWEKVPIRAVN